MGKYQGHWNLVQYTYKQLLIVQQDPVPILLTDYVMIQNFMQRESTCIVLHYRPEKKK